MKKKILVPTDFSKNAWNALSYAIELYKNYECDFHLLHAFTTSGYAIDSMMVPEPGELAFEQARKKAEKGMDRIMQHLNFRDDMPNHHFSTHIEFNSVIGAIKNEVDKHDIELVVIGTKGETDTVDILYGSNAVNIMEKVRNCPVLAVPTQVIYSPPKEIVFPTSYKDTYKRRELLHLIEIAEISDAVIRILHIDEEDELSEEQKNNRSLLKECFETVEYTFHRLHHINVQTALNCFVQSRESDMIAFINKKHTFFGSLFSKPMVKELGFHAQVPVLTLHDLRN